MTPHPFWPPPLLFSPSFHPSLLLPHWEIWVLLTFFRPHTCLLLLGLAVVVVVDCVTVLHWPIFLHVLFNLFLLLFWFICFVFVTPLIVNFFLRETKKIVSKWGRLENTSSIKDTFRSNCTGALVSVRTDSNCLVAWLKVFERTCIWLCTRDL